MQTSNWAEIKYESSLSISKHVKIILRAHILSFRGYYEVTSGLIQNALIELKFDINDPLVILNKLKILKGY